MVRRALAGLLFLTLGGCAHSRLVEHPITGWFAPEVPAPSPSADTSTNAHCRKIAQQRRNDASFQNETDDTLREIFSSTYASCLAWDTAHAPAP
jgi:hypothetical protein